MGGSDGETKDQTVRIVEVATGKLVRVLKGPLLYASGLSFSPDGKTLAAAGSSPPAKKYALAIEKVHLWEVTTGKEIRTFDSHYPGQVMTLVFSPDGKTLLTASANTMIHLWEVKSGKELLIQGGHQHFVNTIAVSPDGKMLASGSGDNTIRLWESTTGKELRKLSGHIASVTSVHFSHDGKTLASASEDESVWLWEVVTGNPYLNLRAIMTRTRMWPYKRSPSVPMTQ